MQTSYGSPLGSDTQGSGRRPVLDYQVRRMLIEAFGQGATVSVACGAAGISVATFTRWRRAMKQRQDLTPYTYDELRSLFRDIDAAKSTFATRQLSVISTDDDWRARAWLLEKLYPEEYGKKMPDVVVDTSGNVTKTLALPQDGDYSEILNAINDNVEETEDGD